MARFPSGVTDQYFYFLAVDATDKTTFETGLSSFTVYRSRNGAAAAAYTTPTINETDSANMPGVYELLLDEDMTIDSGDEEQDVVLRITHAGMHPVTLKYSLFRPKITAGETLTVSSGNGNAAVQSIANNAITAAAIAADAIGASELAADATTEIATAVWASVTRVLTAGTNIQLPSNGLANVTAWTVALTGDITGNLSGSVGSVGTGGITSGSFAANAINAAAIASNAIGAAELASDAVAEIADAVWDELRSGHVVSGSFGEYVNVSLTDAQLSSIADRFLDAVTEFGAESSAALTYTSADVDVANLALDILREAPITSFTDGTPEANWLARNFATARDAELREHPWKFAIKRKKLLPLDFPLAGLSGTLSGAWGTIRLTEDWSGDLLTIRRSSDDTTDDFAIAEDSLLVDTDAIGTFVASGSGFVSSFFDQSGNGRTLAQATTTKQPGFDDEIEDAGGLPGAVFDGTDDVLSTAGALSNLISTTAGYMVIVGLVDTLSLDSATVDANHLLIGDASKNIGLYARKGGTLYGMNADSGGDDSVTDNVPVALPFVAEIRHASGSLYTRVNNGTEKSATAGDTVSLAGVLNVGDLTAGSQALDFNLFAVLTFSSAPTEAERALLVDRLMRLVGAAGAADFGWDYRYPLPPDCLRMLQIRTDGEFEGDPVPHEIEKGYILTDQGAALYTRYIQQFTDAANFDPLFTEALSAKLAFKMSHWLTGKASMTNTTKALYDDAILRARRANAFEGTPESQNGSDVINSRYR